jgi:ATP-dependent DNA helicase RecQ
MLAFESDAARDEPAPAARPALSATAAAIAAATAGSMPPVPSVAPVPASGPRFQAGDAVRVRRYGAGIVTEATADAVTVDFGGKQRRSFHPDFVRPGRAAAAASA